MISLRCVFSGLTICTDPVLLKRIIGNLISNALQTPWVLGSFAGVFVLLSLSMFGFYELQLPTALQSKLSDTSNKLHGGHLGLRA